MPGGCDLRRGLVTFLVQLLFVLFDEIEGAAERTNNLKKKREKSGRVGGWGEKLIKISQRVIKIRAERARAEIGRVLTIRPIWGAVNSPRFDSPPPIDC